MVTGLFYLLPAVEILAAIWLIKRIIRRQFSADHTNAAFILVISILFFCQVLTRSDFHHLFIMLPVFFILFVLSIEAFVKIFSNKRVSAVITFAILLLISSFVLYTSPVYLPSLAEKTTEISVERARGIRAYQAGIAKKIEMVTSEIQKYSRPGDSILCLPYQPIFYFLSQRHNPTRWNYIWPGDQTAEDYEQMIKQADKSQPAVVMLYRKDEINKYAPEIIEYVNKKYKVAEEFDFISIYVPLNP